VVGIDQPSFSELESGYPDRDEYDDFGDFDGENEDFNDNNLNRRWR